ncbi:uncharacterized protein K460DRAFT_102581 [Cucurbitaria berberidis CBS 394.84]|uniref:F-box domain-containing protein n=1 Tax=Cucurbitaria berberidis CBS 394.84 TaxID=1168544 RepID=A0A9P4GGZ7_9PLEO|nr:uncharacterized protein K460DRAFT_102581 [Cucurbitaria berberidis CBS 394.84]KAF1845064.1 hypothetical protein K460DRAFT_102581 [Cucurbitaria berberidis CBS 394.84]
MTTIYSLPPEIYGKIVPHLTDADLREYRCTCKYFAATGAKELFKVIAFHASSVSVQRVQELAGRENLRGCVQTLVWDSNLWDIAGGTEDELTAYQLQQGRYSTLRDNYRLLYPEPYGLLPRDIEAKIGDVKAHYQAHDERRQDEKKTLHGVLHPDRIAGLLQQFPALREIRILNGSLESRERGLQKIRTDIARDTLDFIPRGDSLFNPDLEDGPLGVHALTRAIEGLSALQRPWKLEIDAIDYTFFMPRIYPVSFEAKLGRLTSLTLALSYWRGGPIARGDGYEECDECWAVLKRGFFKQFLRSMKALRSLSLSLHQRRQIGRFHAAASIREMIPLDEDWTELCELSLTNIDVAEEDIIRLLQNHSSTLKALHLKDICLVPDGSWIHVLEAVRPVLKLTSAIFSGEYLFGCCEEKPGALIWWLNGDLGSALSEYLISGGECPLREDNTVWHGVTADGNAWFEQERS